MTNQRLNALLSEQAARLAEYEAAQEADLAAKLALWSAESGKEEAELQSRVHWRVRLAATEPKLTVDATKDRLALALWEDTLVAVAVGAWEKARVESESASRTLSIARQRLYAVARAIEAVSATEGNARFYRRD